MIDFKGYGPLCAAHNEDIAELKVQTALIDKRLLEIKDIVTNGMQADVREIKDLIHDIKSGVRYTMLFIRVTAMGVPALGTVYEDLKFSGMI